ncbi:MAG: HD domain-containing protein [Eggerthellaceae bacterium]|nr:HD domain-containing protein [Eggerthellaceae bacterium]
METNEFTNMRSLLVALAKSMNLVNPEVEHHHEQTAYLSYFLAKESGLPEDDQLLALYGATLHDIGSVITERALSISEVERRGPEIAASGARMVADLPGFDELATVIGFSQYAWSEYVKCDDAGCAIDDRLMRIASIVHLADTVSLAVRANEPILNQAKAICDFVKRRAGTEYCPHAVESLLALSGTEYVWMDLAHNPQFLLYFTGDIAPVSLQETVQYTRFASRIIDYRSPFTAMHSAGVAASARELALLAGFDDEDVVQMEIAGNLHDIGKLAVPRKILEKPGRLTDAEFNIVKEHPYYTALVLLDAKGFDKIGKWASHHHEKINGRGYPFHLEGDEIGLGERIMAVADIFSAITEERPYRKGMTRDEASNVLLQDVQAGATCSSVVEMLLDNYERIDAARDEASRSAGQRYFDSMALAS